METESPFLTTHLAPSRPRRRRIMLPVVLFLATCVSTFVVQGFDFSKDPPQLMLFQGLAFSCSIMLILTAHELGHFFQAMRYGVPASLPYFIPMPLNPFGTMGAVIGMKAHMGDRRSLFDIAITGPIAGLIPSLVCLYFGLGWSEVIPMGAVEHGLGAPLIVQAMAHWIVGELGPEQAIALHPVAFAGWVGIFVTALNMIPIGQLDGGHVLYALLRKNAHPVATGLLFAALAAVILWGAYEWTLMLFLLFLMGPAHPPTSNDQIPLGAGRICAGWAMLLFVVIGFTPTPLVG